MDLYLVWHGSHENGIYGSAYFAATHAELLDRTLAVLNVDCLGMPLEGTILRYHPGFQLLAPLRERLRPLAEVPVQAEVSDIGIPIVLYDEPGMIADNSNFDTYVPEADLIYFDRTDMDTNRHLLHALLQPLARFL